MVSANLLARSRGLSAFVVGLLVLAVALAILQPAYNWLAFVGTSQNECANSGGSGDAGPFAYSLWQTVLPLFALVWSGAVLVEQAIVLTAGGAPRVAEVGRSVLAAGVTMALAAAVFMFALSCS